MNHQLCYRFSSSEVVHTGMLLERNQLRKSLANSPEMSALFKHVRVINSINKETPNNFHVLKTQCFLNWKQSEKHKVEFKMLNDALRN